MEKFKMDQEVIVTDTDHVYSSYAEMFKKHGFTNLKQNYARNVDGVIFKIFAIDEHPELKTKMYALHEVGKAGNELLVSVDGIKSV